MLNNLVSLVPIGFIDISETGKIWFHWCHPYIYGDTMTLNSDTDFEPVFCSGKRGQKHG
jgi:hypothetical protein